MTVDESEFIKSTEFKGSFPSLQQCPETKLPEFAFIGRSNVGKSSLINLLVRNKKMAKVSGTPGKTQLINFFEINQSWYLVDLPGYGYAKVSKTARVGFKKMIYDYLEKRPQIRNVFVLIDSRVPTQKQDLDFINWLGSKSIPFIIIFTKTDGFEATKKIREIEKENGAQPVTIFALTANASNEDRERCLKSGMTDFISKPIKREAIEDAVKRWIK